VSVWGRGLYHHVPNELTTRTIHKGIIDSMYMCYNIHKQRAKCYQQQVNVGLVIITHMFAYMLSISVHESVICTVM